MATSNTPRKKVMVSGCFDLLNAGHMKFFQEASELGDLYVCISTDKNIAMLNKTKPMFPEAERLYFVSAIKYVFHAQLSSGTGNKDFEPDLDKIKPDFFYVNKDDDQEAKRIIIQKRKYCQYIVASTNYKQKINKPKQKQDNDQKQNNDTAPAPVRAASSDSFTVCSKNGMNISNIYGYLYPPFITKNGVNWLRNNFNTSHHDIIITTYPKTGTIWTLNIVIEMIKAAYPLQEIYSTIKQGKWIEYVASNKGGNYFNEFINNKTKYDAIKCPLRVWQTHSFYSIYPCAKLDKNTKIIYITRNPKDVICSSYEFFKKEPNISFRGDFNTFFEWFCCGITVNGNYFDHVLEWYNVYKNKDNNNIKILFLYYEDMKNDLLNEIKKIATFIGCDTLLNDRKYNNIQNNSTFKSMKNASKSADVHLTPSFFRKGKTNDWRNYFNDKQSQTIDRLIRTRFYGTDIKYFKELQLSKQNKDIATGNKGNKALSMIDNLILKLQSM